MTEAEGSRSHGRRGFRALVAAAVVVLAAPVLVAGCSTCACTNAPSLDPNWTPTPPPAVSPEEAAAKASRIAGVEMSPGLDWYSIGEVPISMPSGNGELAFVRGDNAAVIEIVMRDRLPMTDAVSTDEAGARATAEGFVTGGGIDVGDTRASSALARSAGVAFYQVTWASGADEPVLEVLVNASSGQVFAYLDFRTGLRPPAPPILGYEAAVRLAVASTYSAGETPWPLGRPPELQIYPASPDGHDWTWQIGFQDGALAVDAASGEVWVMKWTEG